MRSQQPWPEPTVLGNELEPSRPATVAEYLQMRRYLRERRIINCPHPISQPLRRAACL
ncbi:hypothetical protein [Streptomyces sp. NBC_00696]|uniref:hypothetical protein n=1 Tax=Streptomyces sp. NBC_00696 TaxID=2903672 RepID=UPI002E30CB6D|nr:hypothetical protein [Streptomyces sp. NBC_00696]